MSPFLAPPIGERVFSAKERIFSHTLHRFPPLIISIHTQTSADHKDGRFGSEMREALEYGV